MPTQLHILNEAGFLDTYSKDIKAVAGRTLEEARKHLTLRNIDIVFQITEYPKSLKSLGGVSGYCPRGDYIRVSIDPLSISSRKRFREDLRRTLLHELHHAARCQKGFSFSKCTFFDQLVTEGLADYFVFEVTGDIPVWSARSISLHKMLRRHGGILKRRLTESLYQDFFTAGSKKKKIRRWTGYMLGFSLIRDFVRNHPGTKSVTMINLPSKNFLK